MQACTRCNAQSPDAASLCTNCGADLSEYSNMAVALKRFQNNPRVRLVRLITMADACPACLESARAYDKASAPKLPVDGCSHELGCRCFYQPYLDDIYP